LNFEDRGYVDSVSAGGHLIRVSQGHPQSPRELNAAKIVKLTHLAGIGKWRA